MLRELVHGGVQAVGLDKGGYLRQAFLPGGLIRLGVVDGLHQQNLNAGLLAIGLGCGGGRGEVGRQQRKNLLQNFPTPIQLGFGVDHPNHGVEKFGEGEFLWNKKHRKIQGVGLIQNVGGDVVDIIPRLNRDSRDAPPGQLGNKALIQLLLIQTVSGGQQQLARLHRVGGIWDFHNVDPEYFVAGPFGSSGQRYAGKYLLLKQVLNGQRHEVRPPLGVM